MLFAECSDGGWPFAVMVIGVALAVALNNWANREK